MAGGVKVIGARGQRPGNGLTESRTSDLDRHPSQPGAFTGEALNGRVGGYVYVVVFSYPVVDKNAALIRVQLSAANSVDDMSRSSVSRVSVP
jgi:hypothetical protein